MKFTWRSLSEREADRRYRLEEWHRWFAWYPVRLAHDDVRWLEWVERKVYDDTWAPNQVHKQYKAIEEPRFRA